jgi:hypothetical protein
MPALPHQFELQLSQWESDDALLRSAHFARRMQILDQLDALFPYTGPTNADSSTQLLTRARALSTRLDSANADLYNSIRTQIQNGICPAEFFPFLRAPSIAPGGLAYDHLDDLVSGIFDFETPSEEPRILGPESVFYQPTPARHIFHLISAASITPTDTVVDLGSGLGHVPLLASICTGASAMGLEIDPVWIATATNCARNLNLRNVTFLAQDARHADLSTGTVFYLYTPFTGSTLACVIESLRNQASLRPIRICTFGPCTFEVSKQTWLDPVPPPAADQVTVFIPTA